MTGYIKQLSFPFQKMLWLRLHLANLCNFACPGCHVFKISPNRIPATNMPYEIAEQAVMFFANLTKKHFPGEKWIYLSIYGGEPLLNRPVLYKLLQKLGKFYQGININWVVNTNGSLLNEEDLERFLPHEVDIHISVDGKEEKHNRARVDKQGHKTFQRVMEAVELIRAKHYPYLQFDSVANPFELDTINEVIDVAQETKVGRVHLDFYYSPRYPENFSAEKYGQTYAGAYLYGKEKGVAVSESNFSNLYGKFWNDVAVNTIPSRSRFPFLHFFADGSFSFNELPTVKPFDLISNLNENKIEAIWQRRMGLLLEMEQEFETKCRGCFLWNYCQGSTRRMFRYHTLTDRNEDKICAAARIAVMELAKNNFIP